MIDAILSRTQASNVQDLRPTPLGIALTFERQTGQDQARSFGMIFTVYMRDDHDVANLCAIQILCKNSERSTEPIVK